MMVGHIALLEVQVALLVACIGLLEDHMKAEVGLKGHMHEEAGQQEKEAWSGG
jgi:hypothetical protein